MRRAVPSGAVAVRVLTWALALVIATSLGLLAVGSVGDAVRGRPVGPEVIDVTTPPPAPETPDPGQREVREELVNDFGTFVVGCRGAFATGVDAEAADGWEVTRVEPGPDDDVEVVFVSETELVEMEAFCNRGRPAIAELDRSQIRDAGTGRDG